MNYCHLAGLRIGVLMLSSLSLSMFFSINTLALRPSSSSSSKAATVNHSMGSTSLGAGFMESEQPVQIGQGEGGDFSYQIWQDIQVSDYYLFIWDSESVPIQDEVRVMGHTVVPATIEEPIVSYNFDSAAEAVNFFTCRYARERLDSCVMTMSSVSYDVPETCAFPWVACKEQ